MHRAVELRLSRKKLFLTGTLMSARATATKLAISRLLVRSLPAILTFLSVQWLSVAAQNVVLFLSSLRLSGYSRNFLLRSLLMLS